LCKPPSSFALARGSCSLTLPRTRRDLPIDHRIAEHHTDWMPGIVNASNASALGSPAQSVQILALVRQANVSGVPRYIGRVLNRWSNVHIADVAALDVLTAARAPAGSLVYVESGEEHSAKSSEQLRPARSWGCTIRISRRGDRVLGPEPVDILPWLQWPRTRQSRG
jgi:hypothetical protein